jgi:hypothetical protein
MGYSDSIPGRTKSYIVSNARWKSARIREFTAKTANRPSIGDHIRA